jgi:hypothetical protein
MASVVDVMATHTTRSRAAAVSHTRLRRNQDACTRITQAPRPPHSRLWCCPRRSIGRERGWHATKNQHDGRHSGAQQSVSPLLHTAAIRRLLLLFFFFKPPSGEGWYGCGVPTTFFPFVPHDFLCPFDDAHVLRPAASKAMPARKQATATATAVHARKHAHAHQRVQVVVSNPACQKYTPRQRHENQQRRRRGRGATPMQQCAQTKACSVVMHLCARGRDCLVLLWLPTWSGPLTPLRHGVLGSLV